MRALVLACLALGACGGSHASAHAPALRDIAQVCVLRPASIAAATTMAVRDNGRLVGATRGTTHFCYLAAPGTHQITSIDDDTGPTLLHARGGARYWLHQEVTTLGGDLHAHLDFVDEDAAMEMLESCSTRVQVSVPGHEEREDAMAIAPARRR